MLRGYGDTGIRSYGVGARPRLARCWDVAGYGVTWLRGYADSGGGMADDWTEDGELVNSRRKS